MKVAIFGSKGFLGTKLKICFRSKGHEIIGVDRSEKEDLQVDATNLKEVRKLLMDHAPDFVIDTIALSSSVECEKDPVKAKLLNYQTAKNISLVAHEIGAKTIFISSSYVFEGNEGDYSEDDIPSPRGVYARTKLDAEREIMKYSENLILRADILYGYNGSIGPNGIFDKILSEERIELGNPDQIRSPLLVDDLYNIIIKLLKVNASGVFHIAGPDKIKMIDFIHYLEELIRPFSRVELLKHSEIRVPEKKDSSLSISKINLLNIKTKSFDEGRMLIRSLLGRKVSF